LATKKSNPEFDKQELVIGVKKCGRKIAFVFELKYMRKLI